MANFIELAKALGWPIAIIIAAVCILVTIFRITSKKGSLKFGVKDWFNLETDSQKSVTATADKSVTSEDEITSRPISGSGIGERDEDGVLQPEKAGPVHFFLAGSIEELDSAFSSFRITESFSKDPDFWQCTYINKKHELGVLNEDVEYQKLAAANPTWVWPLIYLIRRYVRLHEAEKASDCLEQALIRSSEDNLQYVLREGVRMHATLFSTDRAFQFVVSRLKISSSDIDISSMFRELSSVIQTDNIFDTIFYREIALSLNFDKNELFEIAYAYGSIPDTKLVSFERYRELYCADDGYISAANNMGVIVSDNTAVETDYFERAIKSGDAMAHANLARNLAHAGYIARAEKVLEDAFSLHLSTEAEAALADAKVKVSVARKRVDEERDKLEKHAREQDTKYKSLVFSAFSFLKAGGDYSIEGLFISEDNEIGINGTADVRVGMQVGEEIHLGVLAARGLCYEGKINRKGAGLLDFSERRVIAARVSDDEVRVILFPIGFSLDSKSRVISLRRVVSDHQQLEEQKDMMERLLLEVKR
ncbi:hypothetical protein M3P36_11925 [Altererythrobacter sp. KTW20L]|uniref:hypothetical protein n=1 Tax=Altererythrobacter sp. KTW20L TaxID=2942210 RepID=UPI0020C157CF|nr:hypothetical protein [Altererythrobacter sp. KTW20L]MCL6251745.1 hypothetical protein [Altererythrobacter sp. KTW20L]